MIDITKVLAQPAKKKTKDGLKPCIVCSVQFTCDEPMDKHLWHKMDQMQRAEYVRQVETKLQEELFSAIYGDLGAAVLKLKAQLTIVGKVIESGDVNKLGPVKDWPVWQEVQAELRTLSKLEKLQPLSQTPGVSGN